MNRQEYVDTIVWAFGLDAPVSGKTSIILELMRQWSESDVSFTAEDQAFCLSHLCDDGKTRWMSHLASKDAPLSYGSRVRLIAPYQYDNTDLIVKEGSCGVIKSVPHDDEAVMVAFHNMEDMWLSVPLADLQYSLH